MGTELYDGALIALRQLALFVTVLTPLEILWPAAPQRLLRRGLLTDLGWALLAPLAGALSGAVIAGFSAILAALPLGSALAALRDLPFGGRLALVLLAGELGTYVYHRAAHANPWLWRLHAVHHSPGELDWVSAHRQHSLEVAIFLIIANAPAVVLGVSPAAALGVVLLQRLHTALVHANLRLPEGRWELLIYGPRLHRWHHARDGRTGNFATLLPVLDLLFGTLRLPPGQPPALGCDGVPEGLPAQLLAPLRLQRVGRPATSA